MPFLRGGPSGATICAEGSVEIQSALGKPDTVHASLPFQSAAAAGLLAVEIDKLSLGPVPGAPNYVEAKLDLTDQVLSVHRRPFVKCPACQAFLRSSGRRSTPLRGSRALASYQNGRDMPLTHHDFGGHRLRQPRRPPPPLPCRSEKNALPGSSWAPLRAQVSVGSSRRLSSSAHSWPFARKEISRVFQNAEP